MPCLNQFAAKLLTAGGLQAEQLLKWRLLSSPHTTTLILFESGFRQVPAITFFSQFITYPFLYAEMNEQRRRRNTNKQDKIHFTDRTEKSLRDDWLFVLDCVKCVLNLHQNELIRITKKNNEKIQRKELFECKSWVNLFYSSYSWNRKLDLPQNSLVKPLCCKWRDYNQKDDQ